MREVTGANWIRPPSPRLPELPTEPQPVVPSNAYEPCRPLRILYIDDEPLLRRLLVDVLELQDHKVTVAASGKEGLEIFRNQSPEHRAV